MKRIVFVYLLLLLTISVTSQTVQNGIVKEYNERLEKTPLNSVEITILNAASTVSDEKGNFLLQFRTLKPGDKVNVRRIEKLGYEIFNKEALEQWYISRDNSPFTVVMCKSDRFKRIRDNYSRVSSESYERQLKKEEARLADERRKGKLKDSEYEAALKKLNDEYDQQLENLDNYIDHFARIDLSELSSTEAEIIELVQHGDIEKAIQLYEDQKLEDKYKEQVTVAEKTSKAIDTLTSIKAQSYMARDSIFASIKRKNEMLKLAGGKDNYDKIGQSLKEIVIADTTYFEAVWNYCIYCSDMNIFDEAERYLKICLGLTNDSIKRSSIYLRLGGVYHLTNRGGDAEKCYMSALSYVDEKNKKILGNINNNLGGLFMNLRQFDNANKYLKKAIELEEEVMDTLNMESVYNLACSYNSMGALLGNSQQMEDSEYWLCKTLPLDSLLERKGIAAYQRNHIGTTYNNLATTYHMLKNYPKAEYYYLKSYEKRMIYIKEIPGKYLPDIIDTQTNLSALYLEQNKLIEAQTMAENAINCLLPLFNRFPDAYRNQTIECENNLANVYNMMKHYDKAVEHYKFAIDNVRLLPPSRYADYVRGILLGNYGAAQLYCKKYDLAELAYKESLSIFEQMMDKNPESVRFNVAMQQFNLGAMYRLFLHDYDNAEKYLLLSMDNYQLLNQAHPGTYDEKLVQVLSGLSLLYTRKNMMEKAIDYYNRGYSILPDNNDILDAKGVIEYMQNHIDKAKETWEKKVSLDDNAAENSWLYELLFPD